MSLLRHSLISALTVFSRCSGVWRKCDALAYPCQRQSRSDRASDRAERLLTKLGWADFATVLDPVLHAVRGCTSGRTSV